MSTARKGSIFFSICHRVQKELKQLKSLKPHGIEVSIPSDSLQVWEAIVPGPDDSPYKGTCILLIHNVMGLIHALLFPILSSVLLKAKYLTI